MIVLTRHTDERIVIAQDGKVLATVIVVAVKGNQARLGVKTADPLMPVHRGELWEAIQKGKEQV